MKFMRGWSLLEVLIAVTVAAVAGGLLIKLMVSSNKLFFDQSSQISQGLSLNQTVLEITDLIKSSSGIATRYPTQGVPQYTSDTDTIVIKLPAIDAGGSIIDSVFDYAVIEADLTKPSILRKQIFKDNLSSRKTENKVLSTALDKIVFNYLDISSGIVTPDQSVRVGFTIYLSTKSGFSSYESSASSTVNIKNL